MEAKRDMFDQQIHDAYEQVSLSDEAQERMLAQLLAAQQRSEQPEGADHEARAVAAATTQPRSAEADVVPFAAHKRKRRSWLPIAASIVVALVVVGSAATIALGPSGAENSNTTLAVSEKVAESVGSVDAAGAEQEDAVSEESAPLDAGSEAATEETLAAESDYAETLQAVDLYPSITLEDGTRFTALVEGMYTTQIEPDVVGEQVGVGAATPFDAPDSIGCTVYRLTDDPEGFAVRYDGEDTYWYCTKA